MPVVTVPAPKPVVVEAAPQQAVAANSAAKINPIREPTTDAKVQPAAASKTIGIVPAALPAEVLRGDAWTLFARLHDAADAPLAETELRRRGFAPQEIELGKHLCDPNIEERRRYAKSLPSLGLDGMKPWLLHLSRDADLEIRLTATAVMATTNDPELLARVRTMSLDDPAAEVRETASRAAGTPPTRR
jgi:hypothetical protein